MVITEWSNIVAFAFILVRNTSGEIWSWEAPHAHSPECIQQK